MTINSFLSILGIIVSIVGLFLYLRSNKGFIVYEYDINLVGKKLRVINLIIHILFYISIFIISISNFKDILFIPVILIMIYESTIKKYTASI